MVLLAINNLNRDRVFLLTVYPFHPGQLSQLEGSAGGEE